MLAPAHAPCKVWGLYNALSKHLVKMHFVTIALLLHLLRLTCLLIDTVI